MSQVITSKEIPPIYERLNAKFGVDWERDSLIIAYDGKIHTAGHLEPQKLIHEMKHLDRQKEMGNDAWWQMYLDSDVFRFEEELLAYRAEYEFLKKNIKNREHLFHMKRDIAKTFASSLYGGIINTDEAMKLLT